MSQPIPPSQKRNLLWNMIQPGDAYDIRKSLIARVPGDKRIFMGEHLQLVCLFQAVEIQRLHDSLRQYGVRFKQFERVDLDRHSYQTQIKELMEMSEQSKGYKQQIFKLKQFIRKQSLEMDDLRKKLVAQDETLELKYQEALIKLETFYNENNHLKLDIQGLENKILVLKSAHQRQFEQLRGMLESERRTQLERQIHEITSGFRNERNHLEQEIRRLKDRLQSEAEINDQLRGNVHSLNASIYQYESKLQESVHVESQLAKYDEKLRNLSKQFERIQTLLNEKSRDSNDAKFSLERKQIENKQLLARITDLELDINHLNNQLKDHQRRLVQYADKESQILEYQEKLVLVTQQVQRLRHINRNKEAEIVEYSNRISQFQLQASNFRKQYRQIQSLLRQSQLDKERLRGQINSGSQHRNNQIRQLEQRVSSLLISNESMRRDHESYAGEYEIRLKTLLAEVDRLNDVIRMKIGEIKQRDFEIEKHVVKIRQYQIESNDLKRQNEQINNLERQNQNLRLQISQYKGEREKLHAEMRATTSELESENEGLKRRLRENDNIMLKTTQLERTIYGLKSDLEQVNQGLRAKNDENSRLRLEISDVKQVNVRLSEQIDGNRRELTNSVRIDQQNSDLRNKIVVLSKEIERVNSNLGIKMQQLKQARDIIQKSKTSVEDYSYKEEAFKRTEVQLKQTINLYEQQISSLNLDVQKNRKRIQQLQNMLNIQKRQNQEREHNFVENLNRQLKNKERELIELQQKYYFEITLNNQKALQDSNHKINSLQNQINSLTDNLSRKTNELIRIQSDNRQKDLLITKVKNQISSLNIKLVELTRIRTAYQESMDAIAQLTLQNRQIKDRISGQGSNLQKLQSYEERIVILSVEVERLYKALKEREEDLMKYKRNDFQNTEQITAIKRQYEEQMRTLETRLRGQYSQTLRRAQFLEEQLRNYNLTSNSYASQLSQKDSDIARWKMLYEQITLKLNEEVQFGSGFESKVEALLKEIDRLNQVLQRKLQEYNQLKNSYNQLIQFQDSKQQEEADKGYYHAQQIRKLNITLSLKIKQLNDLNLSYNILQQKYQSLLNNNEADERKREIMAIQIERLNSTIKVLKDKNEHQSGNLVEEIERLNHALRLKVIESQQWQEKVNRSGEQLSRQYNELHIKYQQALKDCEAYKYNIYEFEQKFEKISEEFNRLNGIIDALKRENEMLRAENHHLKVEGSQYLNLPEMNIKLSEQINRLNRQKQQLQQQIADMRIRYVDESALHKRLNEHLTLFVVLFAEIESLRVRVKDKEKEVEEVRRTSLAPFKIQS